MMVELRSMPAAAASQNTFLARRLRVGRLVAQLGQDNFAIARPIGRAGRHLGPACATAPPAGDDRHVLIDAGRHRDRHVQVPHLFVGDDLRNRVDRTSRHAPLRSAPGPNAARRGARRSAPARR